MEKKYTILTYNIGKKERLHEIKHPSNICEYVYVTDNKSITSKTWNVVYVENEHPEDVFDLCYQIRFNPFLYAHTNVIIRIDGNMVPVGNTDKIYENFVNGKYDIGLFIHPERNTLKEEYDIWTLCREYDKKHAEKILDFLKISEGYDVNNYKGLYQGGVVVHKRNELNKNICRLTFSFLKYLAPKDKLIERLDQTILSFVINKYFENIKVFTFDDGIFKNKIFDWCYHNSNTVIQEFGDEKYEKYLFNKKHNIVFKG